MSGKRRGFGVTWWGEAWVEALEQRAHIDPNRLPRGRTYARQERVGALEVVAGRVSARVRGSRPAPYRVNVGVRTLTADEWERVLGAIAGRAAHTAALLDGELPPEVLEDAAGAGVDLLPGPGELDPRCSCPDWADPCKHAAAVCYLIADLLDADPFVLLHLRGRARGEVLAGLRRKRSDTGSERSAHAASPFRSEAGESGVDARTAYAGPAARTETAAIWELGVPPAPARPGRPAPLASDPPATSGVRGADLVALAADAAERARALAVGDGDGGLLIDPDHDLARLAAARLGQVDFEELARRVGVSARRLARHATAWRLGGAEGVDVLWSSWAPGAEEIEEGRATLAGATGRAPRVWQNRVSSVSGRLQLRLAPGGSWYRCEKTGEEWEIAASPSADPRDLV